MDERRTAFAASLLAFAEEQRATTRTKLQELNRLAPSYEDARELVLFEESAARNRVELVGAVIDDLEALVDDYRVQISPPPPPPPASRSVRSLSTEGGGSLSAVRPPSVFDQDGGPNWPEVPDWDGGEVPFSPPPAA